jgi:hypothetical protein
VSIRVHEVQAAAAELPIDLTGFRSARPDAAKLSAAAPVFTALGDKTRLHIVGRLWRSLLWQLSDC